MGHAFYLVYSYSFSICGVVGRRSVESVRDRTTPSSKVFPMGRRGTSEWPFLRTLQDHSIVPTPAPGVAGRSEYVPSRHVFALFPFAETHIS